MPALQNVSVRRLRRLRRLWGRPPFFVPLWFPSKWAYAIRPYDERLRVTTQTACRTLDMRWVALGKPANLPPRRTRSPTASRPAISTADFQLSTFNFQLFASPQTPGPSLDNTGWHSYYAVNGLCLNSRRVSKRTREANIAW